MTPICAMDNACNFATCTGGVCVFTCVKYGDVNGSGGLVNVGDIQCGLAGFSNYGMCPNADIFPCGGGGPPLNVSDILQILNGFSNLNPCGCSGVGGTAPLCGSISP